MKDRSARSEREFPPQRVAPKREGGSRIDEDAKYRSENKADREKDGRGRRKWRPSEWSSEWSARRERDFLERGERKPIRSRWEQMTTRALHVESPSSGYRE